MGGRGAWAAARQQKGEIASWIGPGFRIGFDEIPQEEPDDKDVVQYVDTPDYFTGIGRIRAEPEPELTPMQKQIRDQENTRKALDLIRIKPGPPPKGVVAKLRKIGQSVSDFFKVVTNADDHVGLYTPDDHRRGSLAYQKAYRARRKRMLGFDPDDYR